MRTAGWWSLVAAAAIGCGCVPQGGVPSWAMHVQAFPVDPGAETDWVSQTLLRELRSPRLPREHLPAEQIALVAVHEIEQAQLADAGLWLSLASYRYHQEAMQAAERGVAGFSSLPAGVRVSVYKQLVLEEVRRFAHLGFRDELEAVSARLRGRDETERVLQEQLTTLGKTTPVERESLRDLWSELRPNATAAPPPSRYPQLIEAFRRRLLEDARKDPLDHWPGFYLGQTPVAELQKDAVFAANTFFEPPVCSGVAEAFPAHRQAMTAALSAQRPQVRANAAATLALAPAEETRAALEARLAAEPDARVKLALEYALVRHGASEQLLPLVTALQSCEGEACTLPASLVQWLPPVVKVEVEQAPLARIVSGDKYEPRARWFAAAALRDIGRAKPLEPATVEALLIAGRARADDDILPLMASQAVQDANELSHADVLARLQPHDSSPASRKYLLFPGPLLARLANVSLPEDLPLLREMMNRFGEGDGPEASFVVAATLRIPGDAAESSLVNWFNRFDRTRTQIAVGLLAREKFPRARLQRLIEHGDARTKIVVKLLTHAPDVQATVVAFMQNGSILDKYQAAELAAVGNQTAARAELTELLRFSDDRYYPNDVLVRHAAAGSLVRLALASAKSPGTARPGTPAGVP